MILHFDHFDKKISDSCKKLIENHSNIVSFPMTFKNGFLGRLERKIITKKIAHEDLLKIPLVIDTILSDKLIDFLLNKFGKIYLIAQYSCLINSYNPAVHRDGQSMGFSREALKDSTKIYKVAHYFKYIEDEPPIAFGRFDSRLIEIFKNPTLFKYINYTMELIKSKFLKSYDYNYGRAVVFDSNVWHAPIVPKNAKNLECGVNKILVDFEFTTSESTAKRYMQFHQSYDRPKNNNLDKLPEPTKSRLIKKIKEDKRFNLIF